MSGKVDLSTFDNSGYEPGGLLQRTLWYFCSQLLFMNRFFPFMGVKRSVLRIFGAEIGKGVIIKPRVNIKYPWKLKVGDHVWIGEEVWIDNLDQVVLEEHVCISQGALLLCGNHDYKSPAFDLMTGAIVIEQGAWIGAKSVVTGGVKVGSHAILSVNSSTSKDLLPYTVYQGTPASEVRKRVIE